VAVHSAAYANGTHPLTFTGKAGGKTYSRQIPFVVQAGNVTYTVEQTSGYLNFVFTPEIESFSNESVTLINGTGDATKGMYRPIKSTSSGVDVWYLELESVTAAGSITVAISQTGIDSAGHTVIVSYQIGQSVTISPSFYTG